jgi:outer membrane lipase/esterase
MKRLSTPLAAACLLAAGSATASPYSSLIVFGDSLNDAGQFTDSGGPAGATTRFTNRVGPTYQDGSGEIFGPTSPMLLGARLGFSAESLGPSTAAAYRDNGLVDGNNWAVGGYRTDQILSSIVDQNGSGTGTRTRDGYLYGRNFQADPNALYLLSGGGNDFLQGRVTSAGTAQLAAGRLVDSVQALQQGGARYIMVWLLPDVGLTPSFSSSPLQGFISGLGSAFNTELVQQLATVPAEIIPLNIPLALQEELADPGRYGFAVGQDLTGTCFDDCATQNPVYGINGTSPDPSKLLFNDAVHPTITGQRLIADYAYSLLTAPWEISLLPEMAHGSLHGHQAQLRSQWQADQFAWQAVGQWRTYVNAGGHRQEYDLYHESADGNGYSLNLGASYRLAEAWRLGLAATVQKQSLEAGTADSEYDLRSYLATAFVQYQHQQLWGEVAASVGYLDYRDLERQFRLGNATRSEQGDTDGQLWGLSGRIGYDLAPSKSRWHLSPFVSADYARVEVDGYAEDGQRATALRFDDQTRTSKRLGVGLQGLFDLTRDTRLLGELALEHEYEDDVSDVRMSQNALPTLSYRLPGYQSNDDNWRASLGLRHTLAPGLAVQGSYSYWRADDSSLHGINVGLSLDL